MLAVLFPTHTALDNVYIIETAIQKDWYCHNGCNSSMIKYWFVKKEAGRVCSFFLSLRRRYVVPISLRQEPTSSHHKSLCVSAEQNPGGTTFNTVIVRRK